MEQKLKGVEGKVRRVISEFRLLTKKERIAVAVSGGKDSTVLLYVLHKMGYDVTGITVDAIIGDYTKKNLSNLKEFCEKHNLPLKEISFKEEFGYSLCNIKSILKSKGIRYNSCAICGVLRRYLINKYAKGFDKLATGHNLDDEAQASLMNVFRNDPLRFARQGPMVGSIRTKQFVQRVKPLYFCTEQEIIQYSLALGFNVVYGQCPYALESFRNQVRGFIEALQEGFPKMMNHIVEFTFRHTPKPKKGKLNVCQTCGEPTNGVVCKACSIIQAIGG